MKKRIGLLFLPLIIGVLLSAAFYFPFFSKHLIPSPLDIIPGMYLPWLDQQRSVFPNGGPVENPLPSDVVSLTMPLRKIAIDNFKKGEWPLWNSQILLGTPLLANFQSAAFNPVNILFFIKANFIDIWSIQVILQSFLAFIFFYLFISEYQKDIFSRIVGSFIWSFNGFFALWFQYNTVVYAALYLPLALFAVSKISKNFLWGFLLAISLALSVFSGNPPVTLIVFGTVLLNILFLYWKKPKIILISVLFILLSIAFSSPQLLPGLISSKNSIRQNDKVAESANIKYLKPIKLLTIFTPDFFGNPSTRNTWKDFPLYDNSTIYNGILPIILFLLSFKLKLKNKQRKIQFFAYFIAIISFIVMIPSPFSNFIGNLNIFGLSSMVFTRFSFLWSLSLAIIASLTFNFLKNKNFNFKKIFLPLSITFISVVIPLLLSYFLYKYFSKIPTIDYDWLIQTKTAFRNCLYPLLFFLLNCFLFFALFFFKSPILKKISLVFIFLLVIFDLYRFFNKYNSFSPARDFYPKSELTDYLETNSFRFARESSEIIPSNMWLMYSNLKTPSGYDTTYSQNYGQFISLVNGGNLSSSTNRYLEIDKFNSPLIDLLSVDYIIATRKSREGLSIGGSLPSTLVNSKYKISKDFGRYVVLKNSSSLPFIRPIKQILVSKNSNQTEEYFKQSNIKDIAIIDNDLPNSSQLNSQVEIKNLIINSQSISFETFTKNNQLPYYLIVSQNFDDGWKLKINDIPGQIIKTNHTFTGLFISPGNHQITLEYKPDIFFFSLKLFTISVGSSLFFLFFLFFYFIWKKNHH